MLSREQCDYIHSVTNSNVDAVVNISFRNHKRCIKSNCCTRRPPHKNWQQPHQQTQRWQTVVFERWGSL